MLDLEYVRAIMGTTLGSLGAIAGVLGTLAGKNPEKYLKKLRMVIWFSIGVGWSPVASGIVIWFGNSTEYGYDLAEILFFIAVRLHLVCSQLLPANSLALDLSFASLCTCFPLRVCYFLLLPLTRTAWGLQLPERLVK